MPRRRAGPFSNKCGSRIRRIGLQELAIVKAKGVLNAEVFGYKLAGAVVPGAIAYAVAGRAKERNSKQFALWLLFPCVFFLHLNCPIYRGDQLSIVRRPVS